MSATMGYLKKISTNPLTIIASIALGILLGMQLPQVAAHLKFVGDVYVDLLKMMILPFLVSAVIVSINKLARDPEASRILGRVAFSLVAGIALVSLAGALYMAAAQPGSGLDSSAQQAFGRVVQNDAAGVETVIRLLSPYEDPPRHDALAKLISRLIPDNFFHALSAGDTLKALFFALVLGFAVASAPKENSLTLVDTCETVFRACQRVTTWLLYLLPAASFALAADQIAASGIEPFRVMFHFILAFGTVTIALLGACILVLARYSGKSLRDVLRSQQEPLFIAVATRTSAACMPAMLTSLHERLGFERSMTELLVPLGTALFRVGPALYYCMATIFIAQLYGRDLSLPDYAVIVAASLLTGLASTGMNGVVTISQTAIVCSLLGLPFEAAFVLFVAVEPVCDTLRTVLLVFAINALVATIAPLESSAAGKETVASS